MKNPWKILTGLAILCVAGSMSAQAQVFDFTDGTYPDGNLNTNTGWTGAGDKYLVTAPDGLVVPDTAGNNKMRNLPAIDAPEFTVGAELRFSESGGATTNDYHTVLEIGLELQGTEALDLRLTRRSATDSEYHIQFTKGADVGGRSNTGTVAGAQLGLDLANGDADSNRLYLTYTITNGARSDSNWTATTRLPLPNRKPETLKTQSLMEQVLDKERKKENSRKIKKPMAV